jgi:hypothetical protein
MKPSVLTVTVLSVAIGFGHLGCGSSSGGGAGGHSGGGAGGGVAGGTAGGTAGSGGATAGSGGSTDGGTDVAPDSATEHMSEAGGDSAAEIGGDSATDTSSPDAVATCPDGGIGDGGGQDGACGAPSYSWGPLVVPNGARWTIQIKCAAPSTAVSYQCMWEDGTTGPRTAVGSTDSSGNFTLLSPQVAGWENHTASPCNLYVGCSLVLHVVFTPQ